MGEESMEYSAESYANEPVRFPALEIVDLKAEGERASESGVSPTICTRFVSMTGRIIRPSRWT